MISSARSPIQVRTATALVLAGILALLGIPATTARADECQQGTQDGGGHSIIGNQCHKKRGGDTGGGDTGDTGDSGGNGDTGGKTGGGAQVQVKSPEEVYKEKLAAIEKANAAAVDRYKQQMGQVNQMISSGQCTTTGTSTGMGDPCPDVKPPDLTPLPDPPAGLKPPNQPQLPPVEAAYLAIATKLRIDAPGVGIGPDPDLSRWKMAVVGHSYWLWATGPTHLGPVSDSASGRTVTLEASLAAVTFQMGDGGVVKCSGAGTPYPGDKKGLYAKSPTCGYTYQTTSRHHPGGRYPVRAIATWNVGYTAPDGSGTIPIVVASQRDLKVGELQTVIIH